MIRNRAKQNNLAIGSKVSTETIKSLIADLRSQDGIVRVRARKSLVAIGRRVVKPLTKALASKKDWVRWEAAKALGQIGDPAATQALVAALQDEMFDVRWLGAEGLIAIGRNAVAPLLTVLMEHGDSSRVREGAHHVLHDMDRGNLDNILQPVLEALEDIEAAIEVPLAAEAALDALEKE